MLEHRAPRLAPPETPSPAVASEPIVTTRSAAFGRTIAHLERLARHDVPVLLEGESGTGKTLFARYVHLMSPRRDRVFETVDLGCVDDSLGASDLFGHVVGAYTDARQSRHGHFATAHGGTLFLDEIGKASAAIQRKLLTAVETGEIRPLGSDRSVRVDVRIVTATNASLEGLVGRGLFLPDLLARLGSFRVRLPPLRERREDIPALVEHFLRRRSARFGYAEPPAVHADLLAALERSEWPFNLRQLDNTIQSLLIHADGAPTLTLGHCELDLAYLHEVRRVDAVSPPLGVRQAVREAGSVAGAARLLGVARSTVYRQLGRERERADPSPPP